MPTKTGFITTREIRQIKALAADGVSTSVIAELIGCSHDRVSAYSGGINGMRERGERYARIVSNAAAYVPTFGGGR